MSEAEAEIPAELGPLFATRHARVPADRAYLESGGRIWTYGELFAAIARAESAFAARGLRPGDRIAACASDDRTVLTLFFAALKSGLTFVMIDPAQRGESLARLLAAAAPRACFLGSDAFASLPMPPPLPKALSGSPGTELILVESSRPAGLLARLLSAAAGLAATPEDSRASVPERTYSAFLAAGRPEWTESAPHPETLSSLILFTSGSTSRPKGVEHSRRSLLANARTITRQHRFDGGLRQLNVLPLHHVDGLIHGALVTFAAGGTLLRFPKLSVPEIPDLLHAVRARKVTHFMTVPTGLRMLLELGTGERADSFRGPEFRYVISGAAPLDVPLWEDFERTFGTPVVNSYGLTETVSQSLFTGPDPAFRRVGTLGKPVDCRIRVVDDAGQDAATGLPGELWLAGDCVMKGYAGDPEATREVFAGEWFRTGDLVFQDPDGFVHLVGRRKELIMRGGVCVYPEDVRRAALRLPGVQECAVIGRPDPLLGERIVLCVEERPGLPVVAREVLAALSGALSPELRPDECRVFAALPRGPSGKVLAQELRSWLESGEKDLDSTEAGSADPAEIWSGVRSLAARCFKVPEESLSAASTPDTTDGWDSLAHFELVTRLERAFGVKFGAAEIVALKSLGHAERIVRGLRAKDRS